MSASAAGGGGITVESLARKADEAEQMAQELRRTLDAVKARASMLQAAVGSAGGTSVESSQPSANDIEDLLLKCLNEGTGSLNSAEFGQKYSLDKNDIYGAIQSLEMDGYVVKEKKQAKIEIVSKEGESVIQNGSPEMRLFDALPPIGESTTAAALESALPKKELKVAMGKARQAGLITMDKGAISRAKAESEDTVRIQLRQFAEKGAGSLSKKDITALKKRKLLSSKSVTHFIVQKGPKFSITRVRPLANLTLADIEEHLDFTADESKSDSAWQGPELKPYMFDAMAPAASVGTLHPLMRMRTDMRRILLDMGFEEMPTNMFVESSFWNFDALFQPQQHPARDAHDTFFIGEPAAQSKILGEHKKYMQRVKDTHESGGETGSIGWRYDWKESEAKKSLLRTHTTAVSSRMLYKLAQNKPFKPKKYFSIDRVFRNEAIDVCVNGPTHLAEFHQVEGFVADYDLTLGHLIGTIAEFFRRIGHADVKFKPAYNPYTEPSMEIFGWSEERQDYIEVGNSGIFRPEMLEPMGLPPNVKVIAWGLGLERPCMISTKLKDIRELFGPRVETEMVRKFPFVRYDQHNS